MTYFVHEIVGFLFTFLENYRLLGDVRALMLREGAVYMKDILYHFEMGDVLTLIEQQNARIVLFILLRMGKWALLLFHGVYQFYG